MQETSLIVIGSLNTDIVATGLERFPGPGEHVYGKSLHIGPGGKSRNIAAMAATLLTANQVAMIGRTAEDSYGLWNVPIEALKEVGVNVEFVRVLKREETDKLPAVALIPVNEEGENQIIVLPGVSSDFSKEDLNAADALFAKASENHGYLITTLECPIESIRHALGLAAKHSLRVILDPGGIRPSTNMTQLVKGVYLVKPNEHEAEMMTGVEVRDFTSARQAASVLKDMGAENVLITHGEHGAYLFAKDREVELPSKRIGGEVKDATGCGDQTIAALCAYMLAGKTLEEAAAIAVVAGALEFNKSGVVPISRAEIEAQV